MDNIKMIDLTPEAFAAEDVRTGRVKPEDRQAATLEWYGHFAKGQAATIARLNKRVNELSAQLDARH